MANAPELFAKHVQQLLCGSPPQQRIYASGDQDQTQNDPGTYLCMALQIGATDLPRPGDNRGDRSRP